MTIVNKANPTDAEIRAEMASEFSDYFGNADRGAFLDDCVIHAKGRGLWDALFDRDGGEDPLNLFKIDYQVTDCRSPESFTRLVIDDKNSGEWPFLHWYIKARLHKRLGTNNYPAAKEYVQKKLAKFGLEQPTADEIVGNWRAFAKNTGGIRRIEPGKPIMRTGEAQ